MSGPRPGDVFGEMLTDALAVRTGVGRRPMVAGRLPRPVIEIIERDDGLINGAPADHYLDGPDRWEPFDRRAADRAADQPDGAVLDIGVGGGRVALVLQERGVDVTGLDISPGALRVARARGVRRLVRATVDQHVESGLTYGTFLLLGNNLGLIEGRERAPAFLAALAAMARPGARIIAQGTDPYNTSDPVHLGYHELNRRRDRLPGQLRLRLRYRDLSTHWFDYLVCSVEELAGLVKDGPWRLADLDDADAPIYLATLALTG